MKNSFVFGKNCCTTFIHKSEILQLKDSGADEAERAPMSGNNREPFINNQEPSGPISGRLWYNQKVYVCCKCVCCCGGSTSYEIQGYGSKLAEITTNCCYQCSNSIPCFDFVAHMPINIFHFCCPRKYHVEDWQGNFMGDMTYGCCQLPCFVNVTVANKTNPNAFNIKPKCCLITRLCGAGKWYIKDGQENPVGEINKPCCTCYPRYEYDFQGHLAANDKVLLMSSIPHLP